MIVKIDRLLIELPIPKNPSANDVAAVQELLGGKFGEMSTDELHLLIIQLGVLLVIGYCWRIQLMTTD